MSEALVLRHDAGGICTLTLNRPAQRNAINRELFREFRAHIRDIEADGSEVGLIVVTGAGGHFCAGHDLKQAPHADALGWLGRQGNPFFASLVDTDGTLGIDLGVYGAPETFVIDAQGVIRFKHVGALTDEVIRTRIVPLLEAGR